MRPRDEDIETGIVIPEVYDGISIWVLKDGSLVNRWEGVEGMERRFSQTQQYIEISKRVARAGVSDAP